MEKKAHARTLWLMAITYMAIKKSALLRSQCDFGLKIRNLSIESFWFSSYILHKPELHHKQFTAQRMIQSSYLHGRKQTYIYLRFWFVFFFLFNNFTPKCHEMELKQSHEIGNWLKFEISIYVTGMKSVVALHQIDSGQKINLSRFLWFWCLGALQQ